MKYFEYTGKTVEEAIELGLQELQVAREDVEITVLEEGKKKLFGSVKAKVQIGVSEPEETAVEETAAADEGEVFKVGICQLVQHEALDAATQGFKDALTAKLGDKVKFDEQNASGDQTN